MEKNKSTVLLETILSIMVFSGIGLGTIGFYGGIPVGLIVGVVVGLLVSILYQLNKLLVNFEKSKSTKEN